MELTTVESPYSVGDTVGRLMAAVFRRGITVFARINHAANARAVGLSMADEEVLIFGDPREGTVLMQADPRVGFELPLRVVVWDQDGVTRIGYESPESLGERYELADRAEVLKRMATLLAGLVSEATLRGVA
jgi:uncharacterized protein (DUF302 family)